MFRSKPVHSKRCASCCKNLGQSLINWASKAKDEDKERLCDALACSQGGQTNEDVFGEPV